MHITRLGLSSTIAVALFAAANLAAAAGFGSSGSGAVLGQPLDFVVPWRLDVGETLAPECVAAEVRVGDRRWSSALVQIGLEALNAGSTRIRIATTRPIDEPVVAVDVHAGCGARITRRFVVLADAPMATGVAVPVPVAMAVPVQAMAPADAAAMNTVAARTAQGGGASNDFHGAAAAATFGAVTEWRSMRRAAPRQGAQAAPRSARSAHRIERRTERRTEGRSAYAVERLALRRARGAMAAATGARLQLDLAEPALAGAVNPVADALKAVAQAASNSRAAALAASAANDRITALERAVEQSRRESVGGVEFNAQMRARLQQSEAMNRWLLPLLLALSAVVVTAAVLAWRLAAAQRQQRDGWRTPGTASAATPRASAGAESSRLPMTANSFDTGSASLRGTLPSRDRSKPAWPPAAQAGPRAPTAAPATFAGVDAAVEAPFSALAHAPVAARADKPFDAPRLAHFGLPFSTSASGTRSAPTSAQRTASTGASIVESMKLPSGALPEAQAQPSASLMHLTRRDEPAPRDVSIEELIDLEQQAEFFVVLGQDEAAIELLTEHLSGTGGGSPLPYLKLMAIHRRRGDEADYERLRSSFNHRFNAYAPEWGTDLKAGRTLEDYAGVVPRLQQAWPRPLDSMAELEALLFRRSRGELFELPAYREVLLLYSMARDLLDHEASDSGGIDLLLPLAEGNDFSSTTPAPYLKLERSTALAANPIEPRATSAVDFDISVDFGSPSSIFDPLQRPPPR